MARKVLSLRSNWLRHFFSADVTHPWKAFFHEHLQVVFGCTDAHDVFRLDRIPAYKLRYLPCFSASILCLWSQRKGGCKEDQWVLLCHEDPPLPVADLSSCKSYRLLSQLEVVPHCCIEKFQSFGFWFHGHLSGKTSTSGSLPVPSRTLLGRLFMAFSPRQTVFCGFV